MSDIVRFLGNHPFSCTTTNVFPAIAFSSNARGRQWLIKRPALTEESKKISQCHPRRSIDLSRKENGGLNRKEKDQSHLLNDLLPPDIPHCLRSPIEHIVRQA